MSTQFRVASLLPSATEIVCALGARDSLVARSHECDFPTDVASLPPCTTSKLSMDGTAYDIDAQVKAILQEGLSIYRVDADLLKALRLDVIITQDQCEVCAASLADVQAAACHLLDPAPELVVLSPVSLDDVFDDIRRVGAALGRESEADRLVSGMAADIEVIRTTATATASTPSVGLIEWLDPPMAAGNWMPTLVELAGGTPVLGRAGEHSPWLDWQAFLDADPDVIVILPCGYGLERTARELRAFTTRAGWTELWAVRAGHVYLADGNQYFNRPGPRVVESLEILAQILHPDRFPPRHTGRAWVKVP